jgi:release factor glutamine methyltransferase
VRVVCGDVDPRAVELARTNLARVVAGAAGPSGLASGSAVEVVVSDLLDGLDPTLAGRVDVLVANPPYLPSGDRGSWEPEVAEHDPGGALVGGDDGHEVVDALVAAAPRWLAAGGILVVEVDERRADDAADRARHHGLVEVRVEPDLTGAPRAVLARRPR